jgi:hypothetical protein
MCAMEPLNNDHGFARLPWTDSDTQLLYELHLQIPHLDVSELAREYNKRNPQRQRSVHALRAKLKPFNLGQVEGNLP